MLRRFLPLLLLAALGACAKGPDAIAPVPLGPAFQSMPCGDARAMLAEEQAQRAALSSSQRGAQMGDASGIFLIGVPVSSLSGGDQTGAVAASKGKVLALETRLTAC